MKISIKKYFYRSFSLIEVIIVVLIISIISSLANISIKKDDLDEAVKVLRLHLKYTRYIAHIDNKENIEDQEWMKKLWTLKFQKCSSSVGGFYYVIYSDSDGGTSHFKKVDTLKEPLSNKYLYSNSDCVVTKDESEDVLLTKKYDINKVEISCNKTSTIGQISFGHDGKVYSKLGSSPIEIVNPCHIDLYDKKNNHKRITIEPKTGYIY